MCKSFYYSIFYFKDGSIFMKKLFISLALIGAIAVPAQSAFAWDGIQSLNPVPYLSYLNPLPYFGIGENKTNFSLNPFTGFKNCNKCKVNKCAPCVTGAAAPICPTCVKAFPDKPCDTCSRIMIPQQRIYVQEPQCPCMIKRY